MYGVKSESTSAVCCGCLSTDRRLSSLMDYDLYFCLLGNQQTFEDLKCFNILLCWECTALLRSTAAFRRRLQDAQYTLKIAQENQIIPTPLTTLKSNHRQGYDYLIEETIEPEPDVDFFLDNCPDLDIKQEIDYDHYDNEFSDDKYTEEKVKKIKKEKKQVKRERGVLKIDNGFNFNNLELYFTKVHLSEMEVEESLARERDDNDCVSRPHKCGLCGFRCIDKSELYNHKKVNHTTRRLPVKCPICGVGHASRPDLSLHWRRSHPVNRCVTCSRVVERDDDRKKHLYQHRFRYKCLKCDVEFDDRRLFLHHERQLHSQYICEHCGRSTALKPTLERHIINQHLPSECPSCRRVFRSRARLARHARAVHAPPRPRTPAGPPGHPGPAGAPPAAAYCVECDATFSSRAKYARHLSTAIRHRTRKKESIPCPECGKIFSRKIYMKNHVRLFHTNESQHRCGVCDKQFANAFGLRSHNMYVHEKLPKPKTKICNVCGRAFGTNRVLANHMRTHTGERPFACARCPAAFAQQVALRAHLAAIHKDK